MSLSSHALVHRDGLERLHGQSLVGRSRGPAFRVEVPFDLLPIESAVGAVLRRKGVSISRHGDSVKLE